MDLIFGGTKTSKLVTHVGNGKFSANIGLWVWQNGLIPTNTILNEAAPAARFTYMCEYQ